MLNIVLYFRKDINLIIYFFDLIKDSQPVGAVMLLKYNVETTSDIKPHSFIIRKQGAPIHHLAADNEEAARRWINVIREAVERNNQVYIFKIFKFKRFMVNKKYKFNIRLIRGLMHH